MLKMQKRILKISQYSSIDKVTSSNPLQTSSSKQGPFSSLSPQPASSLAQQSLASKYAAIGTNGTNSKGKIVGNAFTQSDGTNSRSDSKNFNKRKHSLDAYQTNISKSSGSYLSSNTGDVNNGQNRHAQTGKTDFKESSSSSSIAKVSSSKTFSSKRGPVSSSSPQSALSPSQQSLSSTSRQSPASKKITFSTSNLSDTPILSSQSSSSVHQGNTSTCRNQKRASPSLKIRDNLQCLSNRSSNILENKNGDDCQFCRWAIDNKMSLVMKLHKKECTGCHQAHYETINSVKARLDKEKVNGYHFSFNI